MKPFSLRLAGLLTGLALVIFFTATPTLKADEWNLETRIMTNHEIEVPGAVLEANTPYVIKLLDSPSERHVVQVFNGDQDHLMSMFIAISAEKLDPVEKSTFGFMEVPAGHPVPVQTWFYPGRRIGLEFVYPKDQTDKFASYWKTNRTEQVAQVAPVDAEPASKAALTEEQSNNIETAYVDQKAESNESNEKAENAEIERAKPTEPEAVTSEPVQIAQNTDTNTTNNTQRTELPHTAGELQLLGLVGALSATLGAIRFRR